MTLREADKGRKERLCPLWPETMSLLNALLKRQPRTDDERLFVNRYGAPVGASGVRFKLAHHVAAAAQESAEPGVEERHASQLPACDCRTPGRGRRGHHSDPNLQFVGSLSR